MALIIGGAFLIKSASNWLTTDQGGRRYAWVVCIAAAVSLFVALPVFARTYARMTIDPVALMTGEAGNTGTANSAWTFTLQILTGNLIAGAMWLTAALLIALAICLACSFAKGQVSVAAVAPFVPSLAFCCLWGVCQANTSPFPGFDYRTSSSRAPPRL